MPKRLPIPETERQAKQNISIEVCDAAMHVLHNSYLNGSDLWPTGGFKPSGRGMDYSEPDTIWYGVNPYGWELTPIIGRFAFDIYNTPQRIEIAQVEHLRTIFDNTIFNGIFFEDEFKNTSPIDRIWFTFTLTPTNNNNA
ncbi:hypothetical protein SNE25_21280 [Mucilaginibacter sabulilitoris]|uniref:Uncharacterized protein n=1 Tax=Mucilaginibacter sabulilitoris TaxID=1173583 RepID=A0ABZ0TGH5_9SPHI|nr:hypothetical protein [Mucilaginibacter sabulilitoris]WPU91854.1 hypothetical protein SNE25_21280 [Mucilaginibacter sabulilitoris]